MSTQAASTHHEEGLKLMKEGKPAEAVQRFTEAAKQGNTDAQNELGKLYLLGNGVPRDLARAVELFTQSAAGGNVRGMTNLGILYMDGTGVPRDPVKSASLFAKPAEAGIPLAQYHLGGQLIHGKGVPKDIDKGVALSRKAAEQGLAIAQYALGESYATADTEEDAALAAAWFDKAAAQGDRDISAKVGLWYYGTYYTQADAAWLVNHAKAGPLLGAAAMQGHRDAQYYLGQWFLKGGHGVTPDPVKAAQLFDQSAQQGHAFAQSDLAHLYVEGKGVEKNLIRAYFWAALASERGAGWARITRDDVAKMMPPAELQQAKAAVQRWEEANKR